MGFRNLESSKVERNNSIVRLEIYNTIGQRVNTLFDGELPAGIHTFSWDGGDYSGSLSATGVYFYRLSERENIIQTKKMLMIK
ncbi:MAG: T9SS type A sorting domain-containing protein [Ignavibacteriales bacterium]|nr:T9SS type A sorting domain-containing protein [Ignavibacteriales bacterium]